MATFSGTQTKCKVCEKTVYVVDQLVTDGIVYHKFCFRCNHCKATLKMGNFASIEGVLFCKPHFEQLFKKTGNYNKSFESAIAKELAHEIPPETIVGEVRNRSKPTGEKKPPTAMQLRFMGTQDKCKTCSKTVYPLEKISCENASFHKNCFRCVHGDCRLSLSNYQALEGKLYCKPHYQQLFTVKGNYSELQKGPAPGAAKPAEVAKPSTVEVKESTEEAT